MCASLELFGCSPHRAAPAIQCSVPWRKLPSLIRRLTKRSTRRVQLSDYEWSGKYNLCLTLSYAALIFILIRLSVSMLDVLGATGACGLISDDEDPLTNKIAPRHFNTCH